jgi:UDP-N-acetylmuramyl pentapeptide phosphotransferase/UDP-N-acetylglucosamine-1-phosphate transferase
MAVGVAIGGCAALTALGTYLAIRLFPGFRSAEQKIGEYRLDAPARPSTSMRLPAVGGPCMLLALVVSMAVAAMVMPSALVVGLPTVALCVALGGLGWLDDLMKSRGQGLPEHAKLGVFWLIAGAWATWYAGWSLPPDYAGLARVGWCILALITILWTTLSTGFSDGVDGLTAGVSAIASAPLVVILLWQTLPSNAVVAACVLGMAVGTLVLNQPSNWTRQGGQKRRAKAYLGDSGALVLGSALGAIVVLNKLELVWFAAGFSILFEGASVIVQTAVLVPLYRRWLRMERFRESVTFVPHTEFPLPFLATPFHHHLSLTGAGPLRVVGTLYALGVGGALLALAGVRFDHPFTHVAIGSTLVMVLGLVIAWSVISKRQFVSLCGSPNGSALCLRRGLPYAIVGLPLSVHVAGSDVALPERNLRDFGHLLDVPLGRVDAPCTLGMVLWLAGQRARAVACWKSIPSLSLLLRPNIALHVAQDAFETGTLDSLCQKWKEALRPVYQQGRIEHVLRTLGARAEELGQSDLAVALRAREGAAEWNQDSD